MLWGEEKLGFLAKWSIFENAPYKTFTSHQILYNEKEKETQFWNCDEFINSLEMGKYNLKSVLYFLQNTSTFQEIFVELAYLEFQGVMKSFLL